MRKQTKKGFTIVELVIVIALIAILAAVLIPTFSNVINNAHESNDTVMVKNLNTILNAEEVKGNRAANMTEALQQAEEGGYKLDKLTPTSTGDIVWDQVSNRFVLINAKGNVVFKDESVTGDIDLTNGAYKLWKITHNVAKEDKGYSLYLADNYAENKNITAAAGIDVGKNDGVTVTYANNDAAKEVLLRTNGGTLTVNAAKDTVSHYGAAEKVVVTAVAGNSYHEYGEVLGTVEVKAGHVQVESGAKVGSIVADKTESAPETKITAAGGAKVGTVVVNDSAVTVTVANGANVAEVAPGKAGVEVNVTGKEASTTVIDTTNTDKFAGGLGTEASPYLIATAEQFMNINELYASAETVGAFQNLAKYDGNVYYFKQITDLSLSAVENENYILRAFTGVYDGGNYSLTLKEHENPESRYSLICTVFGEFTLKNMNVKLDNGAAYTLIAINDFTTNNKKLNAELNNITVESDKTVSFTSGIYGVFWSNYAKNFESIRFIDCINRANISNGGTTTGAFTGSGWSLSENAYGDTATGVSVEFVNCANYGNIVGKESVGVIYGHRLYVANEPENDFYSFVKLDNVVNYGKIKATIKDGCARFAPILAKDIDKDRFASYTTNYQSLYSVGDNVFDVEGVTVAVDLTTGKISTNAEGVEFKIAYTITSMYYDGVPANTTEFVYVLTKEDNVVSNICKHIARNATENETLIFDSYGIYFNRLTDKTELVFEKETGRTFGTNDTTSNVTVFVKAYDATGMLVGTYKVC